MRTICKSKAFLKTVKRGL